MQVVMAGVPGAGKGTQAALLSKHLGIPHISTGDIFRNAIAAGTELGKLAASLINKGHFVPDSITLGIVAERIQEPDCANGFVLDGFPRTLAQAKAVVSSIGDPALGANGAGTEVLQRGEMLSCHALYPDVVIVLDVGPSIAVERIVRRLTCQKCGAVYGPQDHGFSGACPKCGGVLGQRADDKESVALERMDVYYHMTKPAIDYLRAHGVPTLMVDGTGAVDEVFATILHGLERMGVSSSVHNLP